MPKKARYYSPEMPDTEDLELDLSWVCGSRAKCQGWLDIWLHWLSIGWLGHALNLQSYRLTVRLASAGLEQSLAGLGWLGFGWMMLTWCWLGLAWLGHLGLCW